MHCLILAVLFSALAPALADDSIDTRGNTIAVSASQLDKEIGEGAGVIGALRDGSELDDVFASNSLDHSLSGGIGGLIGTKGTQIGSGGLSSQGSGLGSIGIGNDKMIMGALDKSLIDAVIKRNMNQVRYCYQRELNQNLTLSGRIEVRFAIYKDGSVINAAIESTTMNSAVVEECITHEFMEFKFPQPKGGGIVVETTPFDFSPG
ncbi:MAG: AgmX/PglI C-terminal domain-containing protein [bacterium]